LAAAGWSTRWRAWGCADGLTDQPGEGGAHRVCRSACRRLQGSLRWRSSVGQRGKPCQHLGDRLDLLGFEPATSLPTDQADLVAEPGRRDRLCLPAAGVFLAAPRMPPPPCPAVSIERRSLPPAEGPCRDHADQDTHAATRCHAAGRYQSADPVHPLCRPAPTRSASTSLGRSGPARRASRHGHRVGGPMGCVGDDWFLRRVDQLRQWQ
jgi:hypothetical protein